MNVDFQRQTYVNVIELIQALSKDQAETGLWQVLQLSEAAIFHKYINAANR